MLYNMVAVRPIDVHMLCCPCLAPRSLGYVHTVLHVHAVQFVFDCRLGDVPMTTQVRVKIPVCLFTLASPP